jgi:DNA mismatch endonuclease, patch repair protein
MDRISRERRSANMSAIRGKDTKPELIVRRFLHSRGFRFQLCRKDLPGKPDIVLPRYQSVLLVHGCFWHVHECPLGRVKPKTNAEFWAVKRGRNVDRDSEKLQAILNLGWRVRVIWECEIERGTFTEGLCEWLRAGQTSDDTRRRAGPGVRRQPARIGRACS